MPIATSQRNNRTTAKCYADLMWLATQAHKLSTLVQTRQLFLLQIQRHLH